MKVELRLGVALRSLLLLCALLKPRYISLISERRAKPKVSQGQCDYSACGGNETLTRTTTTVTAELGLSCNFSIDNRTSENDTITDLIPGTVYQVFFPCLNCCVELTMKPEKVQNLEIEMTTSSMYLTWTKPRGLSSKFRVTWSNGTSNETATPNQTLLNITGLIPGVKYDVEVVAVADDGSTEGEIATDSRYTYPDAVGIVNVTDVTTTSISLIWTEPEGQWSFFNVWANGTITEIVSVTETLITITGLTAGVQYEVSVSAVAGDNLTEGQKTSVTLYTKPENITSVTITNVTTSSLLLTWNEPEGQRSFFIVQWTNGNITETFNVTETYKNITGLTAGARFEVSVSAVAGDNLTEGQKTTLTAHTKPGAIGHLLKLEANTSSILLNWAPLPGDVEKYRVTWIGNDNESTTDVDQPSAVLQDLDPGTSYTITVVAVAGDQIGEAVMFMKTTEPAEVKELNVTDITTTTVSLSWLRPETGNVESYCVLWNDSETVTNTTSATIPDLIPGSPYSISVAAAVQNGTVKGQSVFTSTYTRPTKPGDIMVESPGTDNLQIHWTLAEGGFQLFEVSIRNEELTYFSTSTTTVNSTHIRDLYPGRMFVITVTAVAGEFSNSSDPTSFATRPVTPDHIEFQARNDSLGLLWDIPELHGAPNISYTITYWSENGHGQKSTTENSTELTQLSSGTLYNITLVTVGPQDLMSEAINMSNATLPNPVSNLRASPKNTTCVEVTWSNPQDAQATYVYQVQADGREFTVSANSILVPDLEPGTRYNISVQVIALAGSQSTLEHTYSYTMPNAVTDLEAQDVTTTTIQLTWLKPDDHKPSYSYLVIARLGDMEVYSDSTSHETHTISGLTAGESYTLDVITVVGKVNSSTNSIPIQTKPEAVSIISVIGSTTNLSVSWTPAAGRVSSYTVLLYTDNQLDEESRDVNNSTLTQLFVNKTPGVLYCVVVVTHVDKHDSNSSEVCNATLPTPPGPISVVSQTVEAINFTWPSPQMMEQQQYRFRVSSVQGTNTTNKTWFLLEGLESGSPYNISVVTVGVWDYWSIEVTAQIYTRPHRVTGLREAEVTTETVTLLWEQQESKPHYSYVVQVSNSDPTTVSNTSHKFTGLVPGNNYNFTVTTLTADGTSAAPVTLSLFTEPETVHPSISSQDSNSSILVSWSKPAGNVDFYTVLLERAGRNLKTERTYVAFDGLSAGRIYSARVVTHSGPRNSSSTEVSNATFPNPPGPIEVLLKTTSSIRIQWTEAPLMSDASIQYRLIISSPYAELSVNSTSHLFDSLQSGTPFNISVQTVGAMMFLSKKAQIHMVTTRPFSVENLTASPQEESITVAWSKPSESKETYRYNVTWRSSQEDRSVITDTTQYNITDLAPGTEYQFNVTTETSDRTQAASRQISKCTDASPVTKFQCKGPNGTDAQLRLLWELPKGQHSGFRFIVNGGEIDNSTKTCCNHTLSNLRHYTVYRLSVTTLGCGRSSVPRIHECTTGITDPPVLQFHNGTLAVNTTQNSFSLGINISLLDDTNGPITLIGVLVASEVPDDTSNWRTYLEKDYEQFQQKTTTVYLAAVRERSHIQSRSVGHHLFIDVGNGSRWEGYNNGPLDAGGKYHYAVVTFTSVLLQNGKVSGDQSLVSKTDFYLVELPGEKVFTVIIVGAVMGLLFALVIVAIGFAVFWRRRFSRKEQTDIHIHSMRAKVNVEVRTEDYEQYYKKQRADSNCGFAEEFEDLKVVGTSQSKNCALQLENKPKNRYNNVLPYDSSRVKLSIIHGSPYDDYINANYMPGYSSRKEFIAAQGPLPATVKDFWRMIWEKNVQTLVMLTRCNEQGRVKCEKYWDVGTKHFENINVTMTSEIPLEDWTIRDFNIKNVKTAETRTVRQFHFTAWPDHGVPETTELLIGFRHLVREHMDQFSRHSPTVVHCSAGVGRTGTFIAIDRLLFQIERENIVDVYGTVHDLRMHRPLMVQTEDQYVFLNQCAMDIIRSRTGNNVDLIYQNTAALSIYENVEPKKGYRKNGHGNA